MTGIAVFNTRIGACGIAWGERGVLGVQLPAGDASATRRRLQRRFPGATERQTPIEVLLAIGRIVAVLRGERVDLSPIEVDSSAVSSADRDDVGDGPGGFLSADAVKTKLRLLAIEGGLGHVPPFQLLQP